MQEIQILGRLPKHVKGTSEAQTAGRNLAKRLNKARAAGRLTAEHEAELAKMMERELGNLSEAESPPDPLDPFADDAGNRLVQDLLMFAHSIRPRPLLRRVARYKRYMNEPALQGERFETLEHMLMICRLLHISCFAPLMVAEPWCVSYVSDPFVAVRAVGIA